LASFKALLKFAKVRVIADKTRTFALIAAARRRNADA